MQVLDGESFECFDRISLDYVDLPGKLTSVCRISLGWSRHTFALGPWMSRMPDAFGRGVLLSEWPLLVSCLSNEEL